MSIITTNAARTTALFLHGLPEAVNINRQSRCRFFSRRRQLLHRFVHFGLKVCLPTLLTNSRRYVLNNLEFMSPAKVDFNLLLNDAPFTKATLPHLARMFSFVFANHCPSSSDLVHRTLDSRLKQLLQIIFPVAIRVFSLVQDLDPEYLVLKICREFLPRHFIPNFSQSTWST